MLIPDERIVIVDGHVILNASDLHVARDSVDLAHPLDALREADRLLAGCHHDDRHTAAGPGSSLDQQAMTGMRRVELPDDEAVANFHAPSI